MAGPDASSSTPVRGPSPYLSTGTTSTASGQLGGFQVAQQPADKPKAVGELTHWGDVRAALKSLFERLMNVQPAKAVLSRVISGEGDFVFAGTRLVSLLGEPDYAKQFEKAIKKGLGDPSKPEWASQLDACRLMAQGAVKSGKIDSKDSERLYRSFTNVLVDRLFADKSAAEIYGAIPLSGLIWLFGEESHSLGRNEAKQRPEGYVAMQKALEAMQGQGGSSSLELYLPLERVVHLAKSAMPGERFSFEGAQLLAALAGGVPPTEEGLNHLERFLKTGTQPLDGSVYRGSLVDLYQSLQQA